MKVEIEKRNPPDGCHFGSRDSSVRLTSLPFDDFSTELGYPMAS